MCWSTRPICAPHHDWSTMFPAYRQVILDKLKRTAGLEDIEERIVVERAPDAAGHPRPLQGAGRRDLRAGLARRLPRRLQAGQPVEGGQGALPLRRRRASGPGHADGDDVAAGSRPMRWTATSAGAACRRRRNAPAGATRRSPRNRDVAAPRAREVPEAVARYSARHMAFFDCHVHALLRAPHARAARAALGHAAGDARRAMPATADHPANHPSWWDGVAFMLLQRRLLPGTAHVHPDGGGGARPIRLHAARSACSASRPARRAAPWPSCAPRERRAGRPQPHALDECAGPLRRCARAAAAGRAGRCAPAGAGAGRAMRLPLALEYPFWTERAAGDARRLRPADRRHAALLALDRDARAARLAAALGGDDATAWPRTPSPATRALRTVVQGQEGMGGIWHAWRRAGAPAARRSRSTLAMRRCNRAVRA